MSKAKANKLTTIDVEVKSIRNLSEMGGAIFSGLTKAARRYTVHLTYKQLRDSTLLHEGQV